MKRYAIYYTPPEASALATAAAAWLGRDACGRRCAAEEGTDGISQSHRAEIIASPAHYGFHGTIKPPFPLADGRTEAALATALAEFCRRRSAFPLPLLVISEIDDFLCLRPAEPCPALKELAAAAVREFEGFRQPSPPEELARRRVVGLTARQEELLQSYGYPWVLDEFRFHLTLTGRIADPAERAAVTRDLARRLPPSIRSGIPCHGLALFVEDNGQALTMQANCPFSA